MNATELKVKTQITHFRVPSAMLRYALITVMSLDGKEKPNAGQSLDLGKPRILGFLL